MVPDREKFAQLEASVFGRFKALAGLSDEMLQAPTKVSLHVFFLITGFTTGIFLSTV